jgi:hypothetical protein
VIFIYLLELVVGHNRSARGQDLRDLRISMDGTTEQVTLVCDKIPLFPLQQVAEITPCRTNYRFLTSGEVKTHKVETPYHDNNLILTPIISSQSG